MKQLFSAGFVIFYKHEDTIEYLLLHYPHGHWDFAKGKIEQGESKEQAALRELKEETGLSATIIPNFTHEISYIFTDHNGEHIQKIVTFMIGEAQKKDVELSFEHVGYVWLPYDQALEKLTYDNAKQILEKANCYILPKIRA